MFNTAFSFPLLFNRLIACSLVTVLLFAALKSYDSMDEELFAHSLKEREPFSYSLSDGMSDFTSRHDEVITRSIGGIKTGMGGAGIVSSLGVGGFTAPITGGGSAVLGALGATASTAYAIDGYRQAFGPHTHNEGAKVLQSFEVPTGSFAVEKATSVATDIALTTAGITLVKSIGTVGAKVAQTRPVQDAITKVMTGGSGVTGPPTKSVVITDGVRTTATTTATVTGSTTGTVKATSPLLPNEGRVGTYRELTKISKKDNLDAHHVPNDQYMRLYGVNKKDGISILIRDSFHREIHKTLKKQDVEMLPRDALAQSVFKVREVYKKHDLYLPQIKDGLKEHIDKSKEAFPSMFKDKAKK